MHSNPSRPAPVIECPYECELTSVRMSNPLAHGHYEWCHKKCSHYPKAVRQRRVGPDKSVDIKVEGKPGWQKVIRKPRKAPERKYSRCIVCDGLFPVNGPDSRRGRVTCSNPACIGKVRSIQQRDARERRKRETLDVSNTPIEERKICPVCGCEFRQLVKKQATCLQEHCIRWYPLIRWKYLHGKKTMVPNL